MRNTAIKFVAAGMLALSVLSGCSFKSPVDGNGRELTIRLEEEPRMERGEFSLLSAPSTTSDFSCFTLNITGSGVGARVPDGVSNCSTSQNFRGKGQGIMVRPFVRGSSVSVDVPGGTGRTIDVWGIYPPVSDCGTNSPTSSYGYFLGGVTRDIQEALSVTIPINYSTSVNNDLLSCSSGGGGSTTTTKYFLITGLAGVGTESFELDTATGALTAVGDQATAGSSFAVNTSIPVVVYTSGATTATTLLVSSSGSLSAGPSDSVGGASLIPVLAPSGHFLWVTTGATLSIFNISSGGNLTSGPAGLTGLSSASKFYVEPTERFGFFNQGTDNISYHNVNSSTGEWSTSNGTVGVTAASQVNRMISNSAGTHLYAALGSSGNTIQDFSINQSTAALTSVGTQGTGTFLYMDIDPQDRWLFAINGSNVNIFPITSGVLGAPSSAAIGVASPTAISVDPTGNYVFVKSYTTNSIERFSINQSTGALTSLGTTSTNASYNNGSFMGFTKVTVTQ